MKPLPPAILFDLDDTILYGGYREDVLGHIAAELADELAAADPPGLVDALETAFRVYWSDPDRHRDGRFALAEVRRRVVAGVFARDGRPQLTEALAHRFADRFTAAREAMMRPFDGAVETVAELKARGVRLALITNGDGATQRGKIERFSLAGYFDHIQIEGEHGFGKPEPQAYRHCMAAIGAAPADCWIVGDDLEWEVAAPQRLGLHAIWHDHRGAGLPPGSEVRPDRIIRALTELLE
ncbi:MAG TPA: HAD family hydrolase [Phenylobacterium sp.]